MAEFLTTKELAALLRIKERKVYDLAAAGEIPCNRAMGKLLFPKAAVEAWLARHGSGRDVAASDSRPSVILGSHDPLLDWALRESRCGLATFFDGSHDGLDRFARGEGIAAGLHIFDKATNDWNTGAVIAKLREQPVVLIEFAWRERGFIVPMGQAAHISGLGDLRGKRLAPRQPEAGSQGMLRQLIGEAGLRESDFTFCEPVRSESDAALAVQDGRADAAFGLKGPAAQHRLDFVPVLKERFDLLIWRRAWFEPALQCFAAFCASDAFVKKAAALGGYDVTRLGAVHFNGA